MTKHIERQAIAEQHLQFILSGSEEEARKRADNSGNISAQLWHNNFKLLVILLYTTGLRVSEALALNNITIQRMARGEELVIHVGKTQTARTLLLTEKEMALFQHHLPPNFLATLPPHGLSNTNGKKLDKRTATRWHEPYFASLHSDFIGQSTVRLPGCAFGTHSYRIGYINRYRRAFDVAEIQQRVGHSNFQSTLRYFRKGNAQSMTKRANDAGL